MSRVHAFCDDALQTDDAVGLVARLRAREVSPAELVEAAIARAETVNAAVNGIARRDYDRARRQAASPPSGFFAGVPIMIKDESDEVGLPTQQGSDAFVSTVKTRDATIVHVMKRVGLISIGRTTLSEFGLNVTAEHPRLGAVRTPWSTDHIAGASSAGSAALVAAGVVPIAKASDGGGSIRIPAAVNGLVGLKTTRGRLPLDGILKFMPVGIVNEGVLTRSVRDTAAFFREAERLYPLKRVRRVGDVRGPGTRRLRVAVTTASPGGALSAEAVALTRQTGRLLEDLGHHVDEVAPPLSASFADDFVNYWCCLSWLQIHAGASVGTRWNLARLDPFTQGLAARGRRNAYRMGGVIHRLRRAGRSICGFFDHYDILLTATLGHETPLVGDLGPMRPFEELLAKVRQWVVFTPVANVCGIPSISLPLATTSAGLPFGMMFCAGYGHDAMLLELAYELEQAQPFARIQG